MTEPAIGSATALLLSAIDCLGPVAESNDVSVNIEAGLRAILAAAENRDADQVPSDVVQFAIQACLDAIAPASAHFGQSPLPSTIDFGLRSAGSLAEGLGQPLAAIPRYVRELSIPAWIDGAYILLAEMDAATRWRRITERAAAAGVSGFTPAPRRIRTSTPARALPTGWKVMGR